MPDHRHTAPLRGEAVIAHLLDEHGHILANRDPIRSQRIHENEHADQDPDPVQPYAVLPHLLSGVYKHYKGPLYKVQGYAHDANHEGRTVVIYCALSLDGAKTGARDAVREYMDFFAWVHPDGSTRGIPVDAHEQRQWWREGIRPRFRYLGPTWEGQT